MALIKRSSQQTQVATIPVVEVSEKQAKQEDDGLVLRSQDQERCDLIYGESGVGKTENLGLAALYVWEKYGKITRLVSADGGGWKPLQPYIDLGIVQPLSISASKTPLKVLMALARGFWPEIVDGQKVYKPIDEKVLEGSEKDGKPGVGAEMFEGLTSFADSVMLSLLRRKDIHIPETPKESFVKDGDDYWGFSGRAHYGFVQGRMQELVGLINGLPYFKLLMTALELRGTDPETGESCYGPKIIGSALTGRAPAWFGDCIHLESVKSEEVEDDQRSDYKQTVKGGIRKRHIRAYLSNHPDPVTGINYKAKCRASAWVSADVPNYFDVVINQEKQQGINWLYEQEDLWAANASQMIASKLKRQPPSVLYGRKNMVSLSLPEVDKSLEPLVESKLEVEDVVLEVAEKVARELNVQ